MESLETLPKQNVVGDDWWKTVKCGGLILSCSPRNPHEKACNEKKTNIPPKVFETLNLFRQFEFPEKEKVL